MIDSAQQGDFDLHIGTLDQILSWMIVQAAAATDPVNRQTLKHHADDLVGVGEKVLSALARAGMPSHRCHIEHLAQAGSQAVCRACNWKSDVYAEGDMVGPVSLAKTDAYDHEHENPTDL